MALAHRQDRGLGVQLGPVETIGAAAGRQRGEHHVQQPFTQALHQLEGAQLVDLHLHLGVALAVAVEAVDELRAGGDRRHADGDLAVHHALEGVDLLPRAAHLFEDQPGATHQALTEIRGGNAAVGAHQQLHPEVGLKLLDALGQGGLRDVQQARGLLDAAALVDGKQRAELVQLHGIPLFGFIGPDCDARLMPCARARTLLQAPGGDSALRDERRSRVPRVNGNAIFKRTLSPTTIFSGAAKAASDLCMGSATITLDNAEAMVKYANKNINSTDVKIQNTRINLFRKPTQTRLKAP